MINLSPMRAQVAHTVATGDRVHLQLPAPCHKNVFVNFVRRNKEFHEPWVYVSSDPKFYDQYLRRMKMGSSLGFFVFTNMGSEFVGVINLNSIRLDPFSSASLGYYADEGFCKKGLMKEGIRLVLGHAFIR